MLGRPSTYNEEVATEICRRISLGETLSEICRSEGMPPRQTVVDWVLRDHNSFSGKYARARDMQIESWADDVLSIADDGKNDWMERNDPGNKGYELNGEHVQRSRLRSDNRRWLLSKLKPGKYGDKLQVAGDPENPIRTVTRIEMVPVEPEPREE